MAKRWITTARWRPDVVATDVGGGMEQLTVEYVPVEPEKEIQYFDINRKKRRRKRKSKAYKAVIVSLMIFPILFGLMYSVLFLQHDIAYIAWMASWIAFDLVVLKANERRRK